MVVNKLKRAFIMALGAGTLTMNAQDATASKQQAPASASIHKTEQLYQVPVEQLTFDYAFGDQIAAAMNVPGATGKNWGIKQSLAGLEKFLEENPGALKGKIVFAALGDCTLGDYLFRKNKLSKMLLEAVGDGHIVLMGVSEKRTDGLGNYANREIQKFVKKNPKVMIFGGATMLVEKGEQLDKNRDYIYPETQEEFDYIIDRAHAALNKALKPALAAKKPVIQGP